GAVACQRDCSGHSTLRIATRINASCSALGHGRTRPAGTILDLSDVDGWSGDRICRLDQPTNHGFIRSLSERATAYKSALRHGVVVGSHRILRHQSYRSTLLAAWPRSY